jgi:exonuclease V
LADEPSDTRSPLLKFRTYPRKPLSVSDLTAGAWCELQYEYTLVRLPGGKKTRTVAMKEGSRLHQKLEDQVHTTVEVEIATKEDAFGLKVWNIIQGLRTLRDTGLTRELEVWGLVDGNVVNGLIDYLSYQSPSPDFEQQWLSSQGSQTSAEDKSQNKITSFFPSDQPEQTRSKKLRKVYLTDVKTRGSKSLPKGAALRPTKVQLYLYHRFLSDMASDKVDFLQVFRRYGLDVDSPFSDAFLAQIGELHDDVFHDSSSALSSTTAPSQQSDTHDHLKYRTLHELVPLLRDELRLTFPAGGDSLGSVVTVEYRLRGEEGECIGSHHIAVDPQVLDQYLGAYMQWWRGERAAKGVEIEDVYKCSYCEFAEICTWRKDIDRKNLRRAQEKINAQNQEGGVGAGGNRKKGPKSPKTRRRKGSPLAEAVE